MFIKEEGDELDPTRRREFLVRSSYITLFLQHLVTNMINML